MNKKRSRLLFFAPLIILLMIFAGCSQSLYIKGKMASEKGEYKLANKMLYEAVEEEPKNNKIWQEIGIVYYRQNYFDKAVESFQMANRIKPDALSNLYLGLILEQKMQYEQALNSYIAAVNLQGSGKTKKMIQARLDALIDRKLRHDAAMALRNEADIAVDSIPENSIAVVNFDGSSLPRELEPLALGLAEFTAIDLAKVNSLNVVERLKISVILDELELNQTRYSDVTTGPRIGRLLGSREMVMGAVLSDGDNGFRISGAIVSTTDSTVNRTEEVNGRLNRFFEIQKDFVFQLIDSLGIKLTKEERDEINEVPTESFLAFMAYSQGLFYQRQGLHGNAERSFDNAQRHDPDFSQAAQMSAKMNQTIAYATDKSRGEERTTLTEEFEKEVKQAMKTEEQEVSLDHIQAINLINSGFITDPDTYGRFGSSIIPPPFGGPFISGSATIIVEGNIDAD